MGAARRADTWVRAPTTGESPSPQPSPVEGEGVWERRGGRTRGSAPTIGESPSPQPSPVEGPSRERRGISLIETELLRCPSVASQRC